VTFPARQHAINGGRRSFALLRPTVDPTAQAAVRDAILEAYTDAEAAATTPNNRRRAGRAPRPRFSFGVPRRNVLHRVGNRPTELRALNDSTSRCSFFECVAKAVERFQARASYV
jgi:hypothetical protein